MHVIGTAGHVDHGKSSLVRAMTGMDPDRFEEEKRRGLTIDLGFAWCSLPSGAQVGIVDVPGHERFIKNMLAGVGSIDAALFVVASDEGWMPQSAEHLEILDFLDVTAGVVALTKSDAVDEDLVLAASEEVSERTRGTVLEGCPIVPVSSVTGAGLPELLATMDRVLQDVPPAADEGRPRLFVDRAFTITGAGTVVTGTLTGGRLSAGEEVDVLPSGHRARIRTLQTHRHTVECAVPGSRVAANLAGLDRHRIMRGDALVRPGEWRQTKTFAARIRTARRLDHALVERGAYELYIGSAELPCRIRFLEDPPAQGKGLGPGESLLAQVFTMRPVPVQTMDRFVIRDIGRWQTVAGGLVLDHAPERLPRGDPEVLERLRGRESDVGGDLIGRVVRERGAVSTADLRWLSGASDERLAEAVTRAVSEGSVVTVGDWVLAPTHASELADEAVRLVTEHHSANPLDPGMPREALRSKLDAAPKLFGDLLKAWERDRLLEATGAHVRLPGRGTDLPPELTDEAQRTLTRLRAGGSSPPDPGSIGASMALLKALERAGEIVLVGGAIAYPSDVYRDIEQRVVDLIGSRGPATVAEVRDVIGTSRKYAVPLLEHLDATGLTQRAGDRRSLGPRGRQLLEGSST